MTMFLMIMLLLTALFMIMLILIQRGRGGGLAGAFGGMGGQSAFGTKAGDVFTKVTIGVATFWILLCIVTIKFAGMTESRFDEDLGGGARPPDQQFILPAGDESPDQSDTSGSEDTQAESPSDSDEGS